MKVTSAKHQNVTAVILAILLLLLIWGAVLTSNKNMVSRMSKDLDNRLEEIVEPNITSFDLQMNEQIKKVNTFAQFLASNGDLGSPSHIALLQSAVENNGLLRCAIAFPNGEFVTHDGTTGNNVSNDAFFKANMAGNFFITDPRPAVVDPTKTVILFAAPIKKDGVVIGSIIYSYLCDDMDRIFNLNFMEDQGHMVIINKSGQLLIGNSEFAKAQENMLENLRERCEHNSHEAKYCATISTTSGNLSVDLKGQDSTTHIRYDALPFNDWVMLSVIPEEAASKSISYVLQIQRNLGAFIFFSTLIYIAIILIIWRVRHRNVDKLTKALTVDGFKRKARKILKNTSERNHVVVQIDVKDFKLINRIYGFSMGDKVIISMADALHVALEGLDATFARIGIDSYLLLLPYYGSDWLQERRDFFVDTFQSKMGEEFSSIISFPTGQYLLTAHDYEKLDVVELMEKVNFAHSAAKQNDEFIIDYKDNIEKEALLEKAIEDRMIKALKDQEFSLYLQPKFSMPEEKICGAEALVRWKVDDKYYMYPTDFIPILERNGFIVQLDKYMFEEAVKNLRRLMDQGIDPICTSVNFSRHHLRNDKFIGELCEITDRYEVPRECLEIEITESALFGNVQTMATLIEKMHKMGFKVSMDDFGSGYSCLTQLVDLNVDILKIDKGFFTDSRDMARTEIVLSSVLNMARTLEIVTVVEGVETREQVDLLHQMPCDIVQGYYFARPMAAKKLDNFLKVPHEHHQDRE